MPEEAEEANKGKRDWMAAVAMHALIDRVPWPPNNEVDAAQYARVAVGMADALIAELEATRQ
jgi:hypothetical protein